MRFKEEDKEEESLPLYSLKVDKEDMYSGMDAISFVDAPAIEVNWTMFKEQSDNKKKMFATDVDRQIVTGPVMLADSPIFRYNDFVGPYNVQFTPDQVFDMSLKYFKENKIHNVNLDHDPKRQVQGVTMFEYFIIDERGNKTELYPDLPHGSAMASFLVEDDSVWKDIKAGKFNGFSLEGFFDEELEAKLVDRIINEFGEFKFKDELFYYRFKEIMESNVSDVVKEHQLEQLFVTKG